MKTPTLTEFMALIRPSCVRRSETAQAKAVARRGHASSNQRTEASRDAEAGECEHRIGAFFFERRVGVFWCSRWRRTSLRRRTAPAAREAGKAPLAPRAQSPPHRAFRLTLRGAHASATRSVAICAFAEPPAGVLPPCLECCPKRSNYCEHVRQNNTIFVAMLFSRTLR